MCSFEGSGCDRVSGSFARRRPPLTVGIVAGAELKVYPDAPHGLSTTHTDKLNEDLLALAKR